MIHLAYLVSLTILVRIAASAQWAVVDYGERLFRNRSHTKGIACRGAVWLKPRTKRGVLAERDSPLPKEILHVLLSYDHGVQTCAVQRLWRELKSLLCPHDWCGPPVCMVPSGARPQKGLRSEAEVRGTWVTELIGNESGSQAAGSRYSWTSAVMPLSCGPSGIGRFASAELIRTLSLRVDRLTLVGVLLASARCCPTPSP